MIIILGLRESPKNKRKKVEAFFERGWRAERVEDIFNELTLGKLLANIPDEERWNLYYTVADCYEESGRKMREQWAIPFDIDNLAVRTHDGGLITEDAKKDLAISAVRAASKALGVNYEDLAVVFSGNGVQFFILLDKPIVSDEYFTSTREHYKELCKGIAQELKLAGISGDVDTSVWSKARLMRLPNTINKKEGRSDSRAFIIQSGVPIAYTLEDSGVILTDDTESIRAYPEPDTLAVCEGCAFLKHCKTKQAEVKEPQWYAMSTILVRLHDGSRLMHEYSNQHPSYSEYETEQKIEQALRTTKPRTCRDIATRWDGCEKCENYGKVTSPIMIKGEDYIATEAFGFREPKKITLDDGSIKVVPGKISYDDLVKAFGKLHPFFSVDGEVYIYNGKHWVIEEEVFIDAWAESVVNPSPKTHECKEIYNKIVRKRVKRRDDIISSTAGLMNFNNCVVNFMTGETFPHSEEYGFTSVRPFDYDPYAECPTWNKFMDDITEGDKIKRQILEEFAGYAMSGDDYWLHKALFLVGDGANGKSIFAKTLIHIAGKGGYSAVPLKSLVKDTSTLMLVNKLFNYSDETSRGALDDTDTFKTLSEGGEMEVRNLYVNQYTVCNRAKFISSSNEMPRIKDTSGGMARRLVIVNFTRKFDELDPNTDKFIGDKLKKEASGIYNILMKSYKNLKLRTHLPIHEATTSNLKEYILENDSVAQFFNDVVTITHDENDYMKVMELFQDYVTYCQMSGEKYPSTKSLFCRKFAKVAKLESKVKQVNGESSRYYVGIKIKKDY